MPMQRPNGGVYSGCRCNESLPEGARPVTVSRVEHVLAGARRCAYRVVPKPGALPADE